MVKRVTVTFGSQGRPSSFPQALVIAANTDISQLSVLGSKVINFYNLGIKLLENNNFIEYIIISHCGIRILENF